MNDDQAHTLQTIGKKVERLGYEMRDEMRAMESQIAQLGEAVLRLETRLRRSPGLRSDVDEPRQR